jgi:NADP-dependent 3-hydroxy acid dehydrogenase YdfG
MLKRSRGQVVFINSTAGLNAKRADAAQYCATQHAVKAIADSLREEVNPDGIRVLSVHPGRTATPRQEKLYRAEGRPYRPELLVQPEDVASVVLHCLLLPRRAEVTDITIRPMVKP